MTCDELKALLAEYVGEGGQFVVEHHETVTVHVRGCPQCEVYVETYAHTIRIAKALPKCEALPAAVEARLRIALAGHLPELVK